MANKNRLKKAKQFAKNIANRIQKQVSKQVQRRREQISRYEIPNPEFEEARRLKDEEEKKRFESDAHYRFIFSEGQRVYDAVMHMINMVRYDHYRAALHLLLVLEEQFAIYGKLPSLMCIGNAPQRMLADADLACRYNPGHPVHDGAIEDIEEMFRGAKLTPEELRALEEAIGEDLYVDEI